MLRRLLAYAEKLVAVSSLLACLRDARPRPRIPARVAMASAFVMALARLGSLNALEQTQRSAFWRRWLGAELPSADTVGRIAAALELEPLREALEEIYRRLRRNKALVPTTHGLMALVLDGHESHASYRRHCSGCLQREVESQQGERLQFYHRHVTAMLLGRDFALLLDAEPQRPGEDEIAPALRLLERLLEHYPRAFDVVLGDALYTDPRIYNLLIARGKDVVTVLKDERRDLVVDAEALFAEIEPEELTDGRTRRQVWDLEGFTTWPQVHQPVRVVRTRETTPIRRQLDGRREIETSERLWVTTLSPHRAPTAAVVALGHARWGIENEGFNETVNHWHADHVYKHHPRAMLSFWLLTMVAFNLFHAFYHRNLKPAYRRRHSLLHVARCLASGIYEGLPENRAPPA